MFLTVRIAIRYIDIGHLRRAVYQLIPMFLSIGQYNYGKEIINQAQLLSNAAKPDLQRSVLATSIINPSSRRSYTLAANELQELYNLDYTLDYNSKGNSTYNLVAIFRKVALNRKQNKVTRKIQESDIGRKGSNRYTNKDATLDVFSLADKLYKDSRVKQTKKDPRSKVEEVVLDNIQQLGIDLLYSRIDDFNAINQRFAIGIATLDNAFDQEEFDKIAGEELSEIEDGVLDEDIDEEFVVRDQGSQLFPEVKEYIGFILDKEGTGFKGADFTSDMLVDVSLSGLLD